MAAHQIYGIMPNMPKRIIDGEGLWKSDKLAEIESEFRAEYANLIPLASSNGVFEVNARRIWSTVYSHNRPEITPEIVLEMLREFNRGGLLFTWIDEGKCWGYWVGIDKPGRLPGISRRGTNEQCGPEPPHYDLNKYRKECNYRFAQGAGNGLVYFLQGDTTKRIKIGFSFEPYRRLGLLQCGSPDKLNMLGFMAAQRSVEHLLHQKFIRYKVHGEWFEEHKELTDYIFANCAPMDANGIQKLPGLGFGVGLGEGMGIGEGSEKSSSSPLSDYADRVTA